MRMGSFLLGGLMGAAAVMVLYRNGRTMPLATVSGQTGNVLNRWMNEAITKWAEKKTTFSDSDHIKRVDDSEASQQVERIIDSDPELKRQVDEIVKNE